MSEGQQTFSRGDAQQRAYTQTSANTVSIKQGNNLIVNAPMSMPQSHIMQNNAVALGIVQQQQQMPMMWEGQTTIVPNPSSNVSSSNNQKHNQLPGPFASIVPSNGMVSMNTQVEPSPPIAPGSAPNIILAPGPTNNIEINRSGTKKVATIASKSKTAKASKATKAQNKDHDGIDGRTEKNRERNREHARSTRLRKKAYIQKLKDMANGLRAVQTTEIRERRISMQNMMNVQKVRRAVVQTVLDYHAGNEKDPAKWNVLLENSFWLKQPVTPFRSFRRSDIDRDCRIIRGIDAMINDAASIAVMVERIGCHNSRWRLIKRSDFLETLDDRDALNQEIGIAQPESSLSSESSTDSSQCSGTKTTSKRKRSFQNMETSNTIPKVSSSSEIHVSSESTNTKTNSSSSSSDEADRENSTKQNSMNSNFRPAKVSRKDFGTHPTPTLNQAYLNQVGAERISAFYAVNQDDMIILEDVLMCPFVFRTNNAVLCGALAECVIPGMLRANFSKNNKLLSMEFVFDAMGFMQQIDCANGDDTSGQAVPNILETALQPCPIEARAITEATPPYSIVHVNESWTRMTKYSQKDVEGKPLLSVLQAEGVDSAGPETNQNKTTKSGRLCHNLDDVQRGQPSSSTCVHYNKKGKPFVDFMCSYPLSNATDQISLHSATDQITHLLHVNMELPQTVTLIS